MKDLEIEVTFDSTIGTKISHWYQKFVNGLFQYTWAIIKNFYKVKNSLLLESYIPRMESQIKLAKLFSFVFRVPVALIVIGDSNAENLSAPKYMKRFGSFGIAINIAKGGTRADSWSNLFMNNPEFYRLIVDTFPMVLFNIGGNHILQDRMDLLEPSLTYLKEKFPKSFNCEIPPIYSEVLAGLDGKNAKVIEQNIIKANEIILKVWAGRTISLYNQFLDPATLSEEVIDKPIMFALGDLVHFSDRGNKIRLDIIFSHLIFHYVAYENPDVENLQKVIDKMFTDLEEDKNAIEIMKLKHFWIHNEDKIKQSLNKVNKPKKKAVKKAIKKAVKKKKK